VFTGIDDGVGRIVRVEPREKGLRLAMNAGDVDIADVALGRRSRSTDAASP